MFSKKIKCAGCGNKIESKEPKVEAFKNQYHAACFACQNCHKPISGDFRPVDEKPWCDNCYAEHKAPRCAECNQGILEQRIKTDDGRSFHQFCFANASQGDCARCKKKIGLNEPLTEALGRSFHVECFRCIQCSGELAMEFYVKNDRPVCEDCHSKNLRQKEAEELTETHVRNTNGQENGTNHEGKTETFVRNAEGPDSDTNHEGKTETFVRNAEGPDSDTNHEGKTETFVRNAEGPDSGLFGLPPHRKTNVREDVQGTDCAVCLKDTKNESHQLLRGKHFHSSCFENAHSGECSGCNQMIRLTEPSVFVKNLNRDWHTACFNCGRCNGRISGSFHVRNDIPTCDDCHQRDSPNCANCGQAIGGNKVKAMQMFWHPECFTCAGCQTALYLSGKEYFNVEGRPFCKNDIDTAHISVA